MTASNQEATFSLSKQYRERITQSDTSRCAAFAAWRLQELQELESCGLPTSSQELWRYTKPEQFELARLVDSQKETCLIGSSLSNPNSSDPPGGVIIQESLEGADALIKRLQGYDALIHSDTVAALQLSTVGGTRFVRVPKNTKCEGPIVLKNSFAHDGTYSSLSVVHIEAGSEAFLVHDIDSPREVFFAPRVEFVIEPQAKLSFVSIQRLSSASTFLGRYKFHQMRDSNLKSTFINLGGLVSRIDLDCVMHEPGASAEIGGLYLAHGNQHTDFHTNQAHLAPHCYSNLMSKGVLKGNARSVYFGFIRVAEAAQKTDAYQKSKNLLLSPHARADAIPNLEIKANDVKCSHGATVGQMQLEELFYLMSRGLTRAQAEELLVEGFFSEVIASIEHEETRTLAQSAVVEKLHGRDANHK